MAHYCKGWAIASDLEAIKAQSKIEDNGVGEIDLIHDQVNTNGKKEYQLFRLHCD